MASHLPSLRLLGAFAAVARTGSIQSAAAELNVTQPAVSQAIKQLEDHSGLSLLDRTQRPARMTEAGQTLARAISDGLGGIEQTIDTLRLEEDQGQRSATIACSVGVATYWLMPRLAEFYETHADLTINVVTTQSGAPDLAEGIDLAIRYGHGRWTDGAVSHLFDERVVPVCSPTLGSRFEGPVDLRATSLLEVRSSESSWIAWAEYLGRIGAPRVPRRSQTFTNYVQTTQTALHGHGVMLGWRSITGALVEAEQLVSAGLPEVVPSDAFYLVARPKRARRTAEAVAAWLHDTTLPDGRLADRSEHRLG